MGHFQTQKNSVRITAVAHVKLSVNVFCIAGIAMSECQPNFWKNEEDGGSKPDPSVHKGSENLDHAINTS